ncbi:MAG: methionine--tRNA ligase [Candidatus Babeliales bacterium]|nr:methionine--tRNA ligase [Candidatus Babeliales bacterium]
MNKNKFYVTTPIYYATAKPHLGSLYSTLLADVSARWNRLQGKKVFFLTGTDEHGQKIAQAAQKAGLEPKLFVDSFIEPYRRIWKQYHLDYTYFIRTTDPEHIKAVQTWLLDLQKKGEIYKSNYEGWYCTPCETFLTDKDFKAEGSQAPICPSCGRSTSFVSEESYFFKLSKYQDRLLEFFKKNPNFVVPKERLNEVVNFVESGLKDLCISRTTVQWGIKFPDDEQHVAYVWADALLNYVTAIGYLNDTKKTDFELWWPADLQVMGKDILRFHAIYWPAFLMASDLPMPKQLLVHGWIKINQQKMSKSFGNVVDPELLYNAYGADAVRYYLVSQMAITQDAEFSLEALERHISTDLANDLGNLLNRMVTLSIKNGLLETPIISNWSADSENLKLESLAMIKEYSDYMDKCHYHMALSTLWKFISKVNGYFHAQEPWKIKDKEKFTEVISATTHSLKTIGILLWPVMPTKTMELLDSIGIEEIIGGNRIEKLLDEGWNSKFVLKQFPPLFQKIDPQVSAESVLGQIKKEPEITVPETKNIDITDFAKVELVVGTIEECETVQKSDKLLKLQVNFGDKGKRQILSGVRKSFAPEDLIGRQAIFVYNLAPRSMMGLESHGMMLSAVNAEGKLEIIKPEHPVINGTQLK